MYSAIAREKQLKRWHRQWKINLIESENPQWVDLAPGLGLPPLPIRLNRPVTLNLIQGPFLRRASTSPIWMLKQVQHDGMPGACRQTTLSMTAKRKRWPRQCRSSVRVSLDHHLNMASPSQNMKTVKGRASNLKLTSIQNSRGSACRSMVLPGMEYRAWPDRSSQTPQTGRIIPDKTADASQR
jgi:hypothetical protein